jgi:hydrogenase 3 maturation protease
LTLGDEIARWVQGYEKLAIMGIGNPLRRDDGVGVEIVEQLTGKVPERVKLFSCEMVPENFLSDIEAYRPTHVLIIDAAELKAELGEARLIPPQKIGGTTFSSHTIPLSLLAGMINESVKTKIIFLGIQPFSTGFGEELSPELQMAIKKIVKTISEALKEIE